MAAAEQSFSLSQLWALARRRAMPALAVLAGVAVAALIAAFVWPPSYSSTGTILIEQQELPSDLVRSTVSTYASQRVQIISQRVMTTETLMGIIARYKLYPEMRGRKPREEIIAEMRRAVHLQMISADVIDPRSGNPTKATIAFSLTYSNGSPQLAAQVANELVSLYLQQNIEQRQKSSQDAVAFLAGERTRLGGEIDAIQAKLAAYKAQHENELPDLTQFNQTSANRTDDEIRDTDTRIQSLDQQLLYLDSQLAVINPTAQIYSSTGERVQSPADLLKTLRSQYRQAAALYAPDHPDVVRLKREIAGLEASIQADPSNPPTLDTTLNDERRQLEKAETDLAAAKQRYAPDHPDVIRLQELVNSLQQKLASAPAATAGAAPALATPTAGGEVGVPPAATAIDPGADNPPYVQLRTSREALVAERKALQDKRTALQRKQDQYEQRLARSPGVEREYNQILRDLNSAQSQFAAIRSRQLEADVANNLETERKGEHFSLIEPPLTPEEPTSPNRPLILIFGLVGALALAVVSVLLLESVDGSVRSRQDLHQLVSVPPLAVIPIMLTHADRLLRRRRRWYAFYGAFGCLVLAAIAVHLFYRPWDVIWAVALRHVGIQT
jgi:uncharacterized protein involved in exopolysaccharide biosynthesis